MPERHCAEMPHPFVSIYLYRCNHLDDHVCYLAYGLSDDTSPTFVETNFGPFDGRADMLDVMLGWLVESGVLPPG